MNQHKRLKDTFSIVRNIWDIHKDWNAKQIYDEYLTVIPDKSKAVTLSAIQKQFEKLKDKIGDENYQELESPWHLGLAEKEKLTSEAISAIIEVQKWLEKVKDDELFSGVPSAMVDNVLDKMKGDFNSEPSPIAKKIVESGLLNMTIWPLTVREAIWISRLYLVKLFTLDGEDFPYSENPHSLWRIARTYADYERLCYISGKNPDTTELDKGLRNGNRGEVWLRLFESF